MSPARTSRFRRALALAGALLALHVALAACGQPEDPESRIKGDPIENGTRATKRERGSNPLEGLGKGQSGGTEPGAQGGGGGLTDGVPRGASGGAKPTPAPTQPTDPTGTAELARRLVGVVQNPYAVTYRVQPEIVRTMQVANVPPKQSVSTVDLFGGRHWTLFSGTGIDTTCNAPPGGAWTCVPGSSVNPNDPATSASLIIGLQVSPAFIAALVAPAVAGAPGTSYATSETTIAGRDAVCIVAKTGNPDVPDATVCLDARGVPLKASTRLTYGGASQTVTFTATGVSDNPGATAITPPT